MPFKKIGRNKYVSPNQLKELIEKCGKNTAIEYDENGWRACSYGNRPRLDSGYKKTPEEALQQLWQQLNKN